MAFPLDPATTASVLVDLQHGTLALPVQPCSAESLLQTSCELASAFHAKGSKVVYICADLANVRRLLVGVSRSDPNAPPPRPEASELSTDAGFQQGDLLILQHHIGTAKEIIHAIA